MKGQGHRWYAPALQRERERAQLERQATELLAADRRRQRKAQTAPPRPTPKPQEPPSKWLKLSDLKRALRNQSRA
jgi:hypothetical protein